MQNVPDFRSHLLGQQRPQVAAFDGSAGAAGGGPRACAVRRRLRAVSSGIYFRDGKASTPGSAESDSQWP